MPVVDSPFTVDWAIQSEDHLDMICNGILRQAWLLLSAPRNIRSSAPKSGFVCAIVDVYCLLLMANYRERRHSQAVCRHHRAATRAPWA